MRGDGARDHEATLTDVESLAPHFLRVRLHSPTLLTAPAAVVAPTAYVRFWFPDIEGRDFEHQRGYTLSEANETTGNVGATRAAPTRIREPTRHGRGEGR